MKSPPLKLHAREHQRIVVIEGGHPDRLDESSGSPTTIAETVRLVAGLSQSSAASYGTAGPA